MHIRPADRGDIAPLAALITRSARALCARDYSAAQIEAALDGAWGVDRQLIADQTYFVVHQGDRLVGGGGWGRRATLFGADTYADRAPQILDPQLDAAKIRAFFVDPEFTGSGVGEMLLQTCEAAAERQGFARFELMATLTGARFYGRHGYAPAPVQPVDLGGGVMIDFIPMQKSAPASP